MLQRGCALADRSNSVHFKEAALLGTLDLADAEGDVCDAGDERGSAGAREVYLNTHEPFCLAAVGVQGGGKSHTMACVLESCLVPFPEEGVVRLRAPMSTLVLHYDQNVASVCEATGLISPLQSLSRLLGPGGVPRCLPREKLVVLVSPSYFKQRKTFYGDYCVVKPLLFRWASLTADHIKRIMRIKEGDNQLYVASMLDLLRRYQREAVTPSFPVFLQQVRGLCDLKAQEGPLAQRMQLLESLVVESKENEGLVGLSGDLHSCVRPGLLVVADLSDPLLASEEANGIFQVSSFASSKLCQLLSLAKDIMGSKSPFKPLVPLLWSPTNRPPLVWNRAAGPDRAVPSHPRGQGAPRGPGQSERRQIARPG